MDNIGDAYRLEWKGTPASASFFINGSAVPDSGYANFKFNGPNYDRFRMVGNNGGKTCEAEVRVIKRVVEVPVCDVFTATPQTLPYGGGMVTLQWATTNATNADIDGQAVAGSGTWDVSVTDDRLFTLSLSNSVGSDVCSVFVDVQDPPPPPAPPVCESFTATPNVFGPEGGVSTLAWQTKNADAVFINNGIGAVLANGSLSVDVTSDIVYTLTAVNSAGSDTCVAPIVVEPPVETPLPSCDSFVAMPNTFGPQGGTSVLAWQTSNADTVTIDNGVGAVAPDGFTSVSVSDSVIYTLTVENSAGSDTCVAPIVVEPPVETPPATCESFTATPNVFGPEGGVSTLAWQTKNADAVFINNGIGAVLANGSLSVDVTSDIVYTLTAENSAGSDTCVAPIVVEPPVSTPISCAENVNFSASTYSLPKGGGTVDFTWSTVGLDSVSFIGLTSTSLSGSESKNITADETVTLIGTKGSESISCPVSIDVKTGGGHRHSSTPSCTLELSDTTIKKGEEVTLTWDTSRAKEVVITDNYGNTLLDTDNAKQLDGSMTLTPTKDTEYTLNAKRGIKSKTCAVDVEVEQDTVTVLETRSAEPRVAGISLTQVPYTGFDATPALSTLFYVLLTLWGLFVAYVLVIRRKRVGGVSLAGSHDHVPYTDVSADADSPKSTSPAEAYVTSATPQTAFAQAPANLPTAQPDAKMVGYEAYVEKKTILK